MFKSAMTALVCCAAVPAGAMNMVNSHIQILKQDQTAFDYANSFDFGTITSPGTVAPSFAMVTASAANGGSLSASFTGHSFGYVSAFLDYTVSIAGPDGSAIPVLIDTHAGLTGTGDIAGSVALLIGSLFVTGPFTEVADYPVNLQASLCSGAEAPCVPDAGQTGWSLTGTTIYVVPNRIYPVHIALTISQSDYNISGMLGDGAGTAYVDPTFRLAPGVFGYTLNNSLAVPEPASWMLLIVGFGLIGTTLRRRVVTAAS